MSILISRRRYCETVVYAVGLGMLVVGGCKEATAVEPDDARVRMAAEHPGSPAPMTPEHPGEHPGDAASAQPSVDEVRSLVTDFVGDGFHLDDHVLGGRWSVKLDRIHPIRVIDRDHWFACADLHGTLAGSREPLAGEHVVDFDFYVSRTAAAWKVTRVEFHKLDGKERTRPFVCPVHTEIMCDSQTSCPVCGAAMIRSADEEKPQS